MSSDTWRQSPCASGMTIYWKPKRLTALSDPLKFSFVLNAACWAEDLILFKFHTRYSRIRSTPLGVGGSQVMTAGHKDVKLSQPLDVVDGELDAPLHLQVPVVAVVQGHHTSTHLQGSKLMSGHHEWNYKEKFFEYNWFVNGGLFWEKTWPVPEGERLLSWYTLKQLTVGPELHVIYHMVSYRYI